jgi:hypothetical protein
VETLSPYRIRRKHVKEMQAVFCRRPTRTVFNSMSRNPVLFFCLHNYHLRAFASTRGPNRKPAHAECHDRHPFHGDNLIGDSASMGKKTALMWPSSVLSVTKTV